MTEENIIAQHQAAAVITDKLLTDDKGLRQAVRRRLFRIAQRDTELITVTQQTAE